MADVEYAVKVGLDDHALLRFEIEGLTEVVAHYAQRFRCICRCGVAGAWRPSEQMAKSDHKMHAIVAKTGGGS